MDDLGYTHAGLDAAQRPTISNRVRQNSVTMTVSRKAGRRQRRCGRRLDHDHERVIHADSKRRARGASRWCAAPNALAEADPAEELITIRPPRRTTTTSMVAALLDAGDLDPTVINGGIINAYGTNARLGAGEWMVVEADESDGTFLKLPADVAVVTNVDPEHLDHFKTFDAVQDAFRAFVENVPFYGFAVMCIDHPVVQVLVGKIEDRRIITYGENPQADVRHGRSHPDGRRIDVQGGVPRPQGRTSHEIGDLVLPMPGRHNALNATAAIAVAHELGLADDTIRKALAGFGGVRRRFTKTGEWNGVTIIDDYGHHPVEIAAVLKAARESTNGRIIAVVQPHRYTRLQSLFEEFCTSFNDASRSSSPKSIRPAKRRSPASIATTSCSACARMATAR